jgi:hypothetical protein
MATGSACAQTQAYAIITEVIIAYQGGSRLNGHTRLGGATVVAITQPRALKDSEVFRVTLTGTPLSDADLGPHA